MQDRKTRKIMTSALAFCAIAVTATPTLAWGAGYDRAGSDYEERDSRIQQRMNDTETYGRHTSECGSSRYSGKDYCEYAATARDVYNEQKEERAARERDNSSRSGNGW